MEEMKLKRVKKVFIIVLAATTYGVFLLISFRNEWRSIEIETNEEVIEDKLEQKEQKCLTRLDEIRGELERCEKPGEKK